MAKVTILLNKKKVGVVTLREKIELKDFGEPNLEEKLASKAMAIPEVKRKLEKERLLGSSFDAESGADRKPVNFIYTLWTDTKAAPKHLTDPDVLKNLETCTGFKTKEFEVTEKPVPKAFQKLRVLDK